MKQIILFFLVMIFAINLNAQNKVILKDGSVIKGRLLEYKNGDNIKLKMENGSIVTFPDSIVSKIKVNLDSGADDYSLKNGFFFNLGFRILPGKSTRRINTGYYYYGNYGSSFGFGIDCTAGIKINNMILLGAGISVDDYNYGYDAMFFPVYFDFTAFFKDNKISPFFRIQSGYGFVDVSDVAVTESAGGLMLDPALGIRLFSNEDVYVTMDLNYKYQKASFKYISGSNDATKDIKYRRLSLRVAAIF